MTRRSFLKTPRHTPLEQQIRTCEICGGTFTPAFDAQDQCCIPGFERKEVAGIPLPLRRPQAFEKAMRNHTLRSVRYPRQSQTLGGKLTRRKEALKQMAHIFERHGLLERTKQS